MPVGITSGCPAREDCSRAARDNQFDGCGSKFVQLATGITGARLNGQAAQSPAHSVRNSHWQAGPDSGFGEAFHTATRSRFESMMRWTSLRHAPQPVPAAVQAATAFKVCRPAMTAAQIVG